MDQPASISLRLYNKLLEAHGGGGASHHGSHEQDTAYYDRFGETILASEGDPANAIASLSARPELLERGLCHANSEVRVITLRICALTMAADLAPTPDTHSAFFAELAALLGIGSCESVAGATPRVRDAAMQAVARGCAGAKMAAWVSKHLTALTRSLARTMADDSLHRIASSASSLLATLVSCFGIAALTAIEAELGAALDGTAPCPAQLKLSILDFMSALALQRTVSNVSSLLVGSLFTEQRQATIRGWLREPDALVRGRVASAMVLLSRTSALTLLGGEQAVLASATKLCESMDGIPFAAEILGGLVLSDAALRQAALDSLTLHLNSLLPAGIGSRQRCMCIAALLSAMDARCVDELLPKSLATAMLPLLRLFHFDAASMAAPQRLFKLVLRLLERRATEFAAQHDDLSAFVATLLPLLQTLHAHRLHQLSVDVLRCLGALLPSIAAAAGDNAAMPPPEEAETPFLSSFRDFAIARLKETDGAWEVRDSIAELLGVWVAQPRMRAWCLQPEFVSGLQLLVSQPDLEPFVYATVANTLVAYAQSEEGWQFLASQQDAFFVCCSASLQATESLSRRSALDMLTRALQHSYSAPAVLAFISTPPCSTQLGHLAEDDDFEVRIALVKLLCAHVWPHAAFFELQGSQLLDRLLTDSHRLVRSEACAMAQRLLQTPQASPPATDQHRALLARLTSMPLEEMRAASAADALYGKDADEFLHPQSQANEMDCD